MQSIIFEILDNQLKIDKLDNKPHEETTSDRRPNRKNHNRRDESNHRLRDDDDEIIHRIKINPPTFDSVHDPKVFSIWLADMDYYFDWHRISEERKVRLDRMRLTGSVYCTSVERYYARNRVLIKTWDEMKDKLKEIFS